MVNYVRSDKAIAETLDSDRCLKTTQKFQGSKLETKSVAVGRMYRFRVFLLEMMVNRMPQEEFERGGLIEFKQIGNSNKKTYLYAIDLVFMVFMVFIFCVSRVMTETEAGGLHKYKGLEDLEFIRDIQTRVTLC
ncbi:hypothetical protein ACLB2K_029411 [Fragaria x ananassa]